MVRSSTAAPAVVSPAVVDLLWKPDLVNAVAVVVVAHVARL